MLEHKFMVGIGLFFICGQVSSILTTTNAFEIFCNNKVIFSKLQMNRMPEMSEILSGIRFLGLKLQ